jgi:hypothetical protein
LLNRLADATSNGNGNGNGSGFTNPNDRLQLISAAEEIARANGAWGGDLAKSIVRGVANERNRGAVPHEQIRLIEELGSINSLDVQETLWEFVRKARDYRVRRSAMKTLLGAGDDSIKSALENVDCVMASAEKFVSDQPTLPVVDDRGEVFDDLRAVAWILPSLRSVCDGTDASARLNEYQTRLRDYAEAITLQWGIEASIADGLKQDAMRDPTLPPEQFAIDMLKPDSKRAVFWFTRILLVQAVARRCFDRDAFTAERALVRETRNDPHPFVRQAARLCTRALRHKDWKPYIWEDMTEVAAGVNSPITAEAKQLIGEIVIALNMNEHLPEGLRADFGNRSALPACLELSHNRAEIVGLSDPHPKCPFLRDDTCLCPYTYHPPEVGIRRELSRAFCRDQRLNAMRLRHSDIHVKALKDFWREMEDLARF